MIPNLDAVSRKTQNIADTHCSRAEHVALDRDPIPVASGDLHHHRIAPPREQRTHGDTRHVAIRAGTVSCVDCIDATIEQRRPFINFLRVGRVRRPNLGGDGECPGTQDAFETAMGIVARQAPQMLARDQRFVIKLHLARKPRVPRNRSCA